MTTAQNIFILTGEGIECEKEAFRFFSQPAFGAQVQYTPVPKLLRGEIKIEKISRPGDLVYLPGGFSFSDHFGSGKLLAYQLNEKKIFEKLLAARVHLMGFCNGFQVLVEAGLFGTNVKLEANRAQQGFVNRWVRLAADPEIFRDAMETRSFPAHLQIPVRHGEGRLVREGANWAADVTPFIRYADTEFNNGSLDQIAGLRAVQGASVIWGMMPHPEIAWRGADHPDHMGPEKMGLSSATRPGAVLPKEEVGDGLKLALEMFRLSAAVTSVNKE